MIDKHLPCLNTALSPSENREFQSPGASSEHAGDLPDSVRIRERPVPGGCSANRPSQCPRRIEADRLTSASRCPQPREDLRLKANRFIQISIIAFGLLSAARPVPVMGGGSPLWFFTMPSRSASTRCSPSRTRTSSCRSTRACSDSTTRAKSSRPSPSPSRTSTR